MAINIKIKSIKTTDNLFIPNVVTEVKYCITKEIGNKIASIDGFANLDFTELTNEVYIPFSELTEDIVKEWVLICIGERIQSIELYLDNELTMQEEQMRITSTEVNLPWETN
jgi:hypothetical protein